MEKKVYQLEISRDEIHVLLQALILEEKFNRDTARGNLDSSFGCNDYDKACAFINNARITALLHSRFCSLFGLKK